MRDRQRLNDKSHYYPCAGAYNHTRTVIILYSIICINVQNAKHCPRAAVVLTPSFTLMPMSSLNDSMPLNFAFYIITMEKVMKKKIYRV